MPVEPTKTDTTIDSKTAILRQVIACSVALGIMGLGAWSLLGQKAPYHPEAFNDAVTRGPSDLTGIAESN
ncbi:hypothetical protein [uncultured Sulfitobacter sp.]|uniref:hypothetical protein n=1 Tax=uncultured Sulfitobacter sp. TaxID=191468 RepID=UPI00261C8AE9|nr:hypothetical protein [uncultured Sulfitobacter sp.]